MTDSAHTHTHTHTHTHKWVQARVLACMCHAAVTSCAVSSMSSWQWGTDGVSVSEEWTGATDGTAEDRWREEEEGGLGTQKEKKERGGGGSCCQFVYCLFYSAGQSKWPSPDKPCFCVHRSAAGQGGPEGPEGPRTGIVFHSQVCSNLPPDVLRDPSG